MVQVRADQVEDVVEPRLDAVDLLAACRGTRPGSAARGELQQAVQLGLALGHQRGRHVELVASSATARSKNSSLPVSMINWLTRWSRSVSPVISSSSGLVLRAEDVQLAADVLDVVLQQQDARRVAGVVGLELVQVEPFEQLAVDPQLQVGHDRRAGGPPARPG